MRGVYRYWRDGKMQDVVEPWELVRNAEGWLLTGQRKVNGQTALGVEAQYLGPLCTAMRLTWLSNKPARHAELQATEDALLFPLLRAAAGPLLPLLAGGPRTVLLPDIRDPRSAGFLEPLRSVRHARLLDEHSWHYRYYGGEYGEAGADYWLDARGVLARYRWASPQGEWEARLQDFQAAADESWCRNDQPPLFRHP